MGRMYYGNAGTCDERLIHVLKTPRGTVVLAMRPPKPDERGYSIGVDSTVADAVVEILSDWNPSDEGPGWVQGATHRNKQRTGDEQLFDVTILAAFETAPPVDRGEASERVFDILRGWPAREAGDDELEDVIAMANACVDSVLDGTVPPELEIAARKRATEILWKIATGDHGQLKNRPTWAMVCEVWDEDDDFLFAVNAFDTTATAERLYFERWDALDLEAAVTP